MSKPTLTEQALAVWEALKSGPADIDSLSQQLDLDQAQVTFVANEGQESGDLTLEEIPREQLDPAADAAERLARGLPERQAAVLLHQAGGRLSNSALVGLAKEHGFPLNEVFRFGRSRGWFANEKGPEGKVVVLTDAGRAALEGPTPDEQALKLALEGVVFFDQHAERGVDIDAARKLLSGRKNLARIRARTRRVVGLTDAGAAALAAGVSVRKERNQLTPEDLRSGEWKNITLRPYDVTLPAQTVRPAKMHPVRKVIEQTRAAFLELGFEEVASPAVESAFWNFDALFQPQDHPAREMQDTFYMASPAQAPLPEGPVVDAVKRAHEDGGDTGSTGWGYTWDPKRSLSSVLRTHTTAATIRALARNPDPPYKAFCVGWAFRNETYSYKHLPVFHQVDGIVIDEHANLAALLGMLTAFCKKLGFGKVSFKPAFYPYTEPSVDMMAFMESRQKWVELGGAGIFRPEVTEPLGCKHPVMAWGLGVERLTMQRLGFSDIRELYQGGLEVVEGVPLCR